MSGIDINTLRVLATVMGFVAFVLLVWWVWRREAQPLHERAAALPFLQDEQGAPRE